MAKSRKYTMRTKRRYNKKTRSNKKNSKSKSKSKSKSNRNKKGGGLFSFLSSSTPTEAKSLADLGKERNRLMQQINLLDEQRMSGTASANILMDIGNLKNQLQEVNDQMEMARSRR